MSNQQLSSHSYKNNKRNLRKVVSETIFAEGMTVTNNPLPLGQCAALVNVISKDRGERVRPRGAWLPIQEGIDISDLFHDRGGRVVHHVGTTLVQNHDGTVDLRRYVLIAVSHTPSTLYVKSAPGVLNPLPAHILIEEPYERPTDPNVPLPDPSDPVYFGTLKKGSYVGDGVVIRRYNSGDLIRVHDMLIHQPKTEGFFGTINGNTYLLGDTNLLRLDVLRSSLGDYTFTLTPVIPFDVTPSQAFNYGYNMLKPNPYTFTNNNTGALRLHGVLPYDAVTNVLKLQARVGEALRFKLIYDYQPSINYKVRWEIQDIYARDGITTIQTQQQSPNYVNGAEIFLDYTSPYKQFSVIVSVYASTDLNNPLRVITLASYHLADDVVNPSRHESKAFNLYQSTGMVTWKNRLVFWGAPEAEMAIFLSDINDPTYVPFPNNTVEYASRVLKCLPYEESLLVVTETGMYLVDNVGNGGFTSKPIQTNLQLRADDAYAIFTIRNMICFKSRNYYYMVVPNRRNDRGEMQIAPVSMPITELLDNFEDTIKKLVMELYAIDYLFSVSKDILNFKLLDYAAYPDGNRIRYVYTFRVSENGTTLLHFDAHLIYDTMLRTWTLEIVETNGQPVTLFQSIATGYAQFINLYASQPGQDAWRAQWLTISEDSVEDVFTLGTTYRRLQNHQMIDTGKRALEGSKVKRLREVILEFNNVDQQDVYFNHVIYVDDEAREDLFKYDPAQIVDPDDPRYGMIYIERTYTEGELIPEEGEVLAGVTVLGQWSLSNSQFPESTVSKVHLPITGKGYYPRIKLLVKGNAAFELNHISWVYRDMGAKKGGRTHGGAVVQSVPELS